MPSQTLKAAVAIYSTVNNMGEFKKQKKTYSTEEPTRLIINEQKKNS